MVLVYRAQSEYVSVQGTKNISVQGTNIVCQCTVHKEY